MKEFQEFYPPGEVAEWSNASDSKSDVLVRVPWVRIPPSPPCKKNRFLSVLFTCLGSKPTAWLAMEFERRSPVPPTLPEGGTARRWLGRGGGSLREPKPNPTLSAIPLRHSGYVGDSSQIAKGDVGCPQRSSSSTRAKWGATPKNMFLKRTCFCYDELKRNFVHGNLSGMASSKKRGGLEISKPI